jgi:hypothetical protein
MMIAGWLGSAVKIRSIGSSQARFLSLTPF